MKSPAFITALFDKFPLAAYPAVPSTTPAAKQAMESNRFYFGGESGPSSFALVCHNVVEIGHQLVPSDPISLIYALVLCHKNKLTLPSKSATAQSSNCLTKMSLYAAPDRCLPILIEEDPADKTRTIRSLVELEASVASKNFSAGPAFVLNDFLDDLIFDVWIFCLWFERDLVDLETIFGPQGARLASFDLFHEIAHWKSFKVRYPVVTESLYAQKLADLKTTIESCNTDDAIIKIKINGFLLHVNTFLSKTQLHTSLKQFTPENVLLDY